MVSETNSLCSASPATLREISFRFVDSLRLRAPAVLEIRRHCISPQTHGRKFTESRFISPPALAGCTKRKMTSWRPFVAGISTVRS